MRALLLAFGLLALAATGAWADPAAEDEALRQGRAAVERKAPEEALPWLRRAHEARAARLGPRDPATLAVAAELADASIDADRLAEAEALLKTVVEARLAVPGPQHPDTAQALEDYAWVIERRGRPREAVPWYERALAARQAAGGAPDKAALQVMNNLAGALAVVGELQRALEMGQAVVAGRTALLGALDPATLRARNNAAHYLVELGRTDEAVRAQRALLEDYRAARGERDRGTLTAMNNLAASLQRSGRLSEALALHERTLALRREVLDARDPALLQSLSNLAVLMADMGRPQDALPMAEAAARLAVDLVGERHPTALTLLNNHATALHDAGRTADALALLERVHALRVELLGERNPQVLESLHNRAELLGVLGRRDEQIALYREVLARRRELQGERHELSLVAQGNLATALRRAGQRDEALALRRQVLPMADAAIGPDHPSTLNLVDGLIRDLRELGDLAGATALGERYVRGAEARRAQAGLSAANRQAVFRRHAATYRLLARLQLRLGRTDEAWRLAELGKARTLLEGLGQQRALRAGVLPEAEAQRLEDLIRRTAAADQRVAQATDAESRAPLETERNALARELQALQAELRRQHPKYEQLSDVRLVEAAALPGLVPAGQKALVYLVDDEEVAAFVVGPDGALAAQDLGRVAGLGPLTDLLRRALSRPGGLPEALRTTGRRVWRGTDGGLQVLAATVAAPAGARAVTDAGEIGRWLASRLVEPLAPRLRDASGWVLVPDGPLAHLPFEALPFGAAGQPLAASVDLRYAPSLSVYRIGRTLAAQYEGQPRPRSLFAMGRAQYETPQAAPTRGDALLRDVADLRELDGLWADLPGTEAEVRAAAARFPGARIALGVEATESRLQALDRLGELRRYRYLLFSAHGYVSPTRPDLSAVVLGLRHREPDTDGYVTAVEWTGYDLRSDLIVVSACDTATGPVLTGEGVMGLPFGLLVAGNVNTLLTLWPVEDRATAHFVTRLFGRLADGATPARALAETRREMMREPRWAHPRFWAPFVLIGPG